MNIPITLVDYDDLDLPKYQPIHHIQPPQHDHPTDRRNNRPIHITKALKWATKDAIE